MIIIKTNNQKKKSNIQSREMKRDLQTLNAKSITLNVFIRNKKQQSETTTNQQKRPTTTKQQKKTHNTTRDKKNNKNWN